MAGSNKPQKVNPKQLYQAMRKLSSEQADTVAKETKSKEGGTLFRLAHKVANNSSESEFIEFAEKGTMPPIKLNNTEMELLKGGDLIHLLVHLLVHLAVEYATEPFGWSPPQIIDHAYGYGPTGGQINPGAIPGASYGAGGVYIG